MINEAFRRTARATTAVILAAGLGSRLQHNTREVPKCLVPVAGKTMLERILESLRELEFRSVTIVVGYLDELIVQLVERDQAKCGTGFSVHTIKNERYAETGSLYSLDLGLDTVDESRNVLLIEGDVVLDRSLLVDLIDAARENESAATLLAPYQPSLSGTFAVVKNGFVSAWLHESVRAADFNRTGCFKTVNLTFVPKQRARRALSAEVKRTIGQCGPNAPLEYAMHKLVLDGMLIAAVPTGGARWFEVDTPEDLEIANRMFGEYGYA
jgi:choline kinase